MLIILTVTLSGLSLKAQARDSNKKEKEFHLKNDRKDNLRDTVEFDDFVDALALSPIGKKTSKEIDSIIDEHVNEITKTQMSMIAGIIVYNKVRYGYSGYHLSYDLEVKGLEFNFAFDF